MILTRSVLSLAALLCVVVLCSCSPKNKATTPAAATSSPVADSAALATDASESKSVKPSLYPPVSGKEWEVAITGVRQESELSSGGISTMDRTTYRPKPGYTFLVLEADFRRQTSTGQIKVSSDDAAIIGQDGKTIKSNGSGSASFNSSSLGGDKSYCVGCQTMFTLDAGTELSLAFVFTLKQSAIHQPFKFKFPGIPLIPFTVSPDAPASR